MFNGFETSLFPFEHSEHEELNPGSQSSLVLRGPHPLGVGCMAPEPASRRGPQGRAGARVRVAEAGQQDGMYPKKETAHSSPEPGWEHGPTLGVTQVCVSVTHWSPPGRGPHAGTHAAFPEVATPCPGTCPPVALGASTGQGRQPPTPGDGPVLSGLHLASGRQLEK